MTKCAQSLDVGHLDADLALHQLDLADGARLDQLLHPAHSHMSGVRLGATQSSVEGTAGMYTACGLVVSMHGD